MIKKLFIAILSLLALAGITFAFYKFIYLKSPRFNKAGLKVETEHPGAKVYIDNGLAGETPFSTQNLPSGEITLAVDGKYGRFEDKITLEKNTFSLVNLKIASVSEFSSSQVLWLEKYSGGQALSILSNVLGVTVSIDGQEQGLAPLTMENILVGDHTIALIKEGYETVSAKVKVTEGYKVNFKAYLAPNILPTEFETVDYETSDLVAIRNYTPDQLPNSILASPSTWAKGLGYIKETQPDLDLDFEYILDYAGKLYDRQGLPVTSYKDLTASEGFVIAYLGENSTGTTISTKAENTLDEFLTAVFGELGPTIEIGSTGLGFLRVREEPLVGATEVGRVNEGDKFKVLEEKSGWYKIEYAVGKQGWVSGDYVTEVEKEN